MKSFDEVDRLTLPEYRLLIKATEYREVDKDYRNHLQAYLDFTAQAKKKKGKGEAPVYNTFHKFYDYEKELEKVENPKKLDERFLGMRDIITKGEDDG
jgi:cell fate (sporulation/competence/biofilm development) regulator YlbF (YheA/YmcA/DUF963 family)